MFQNNAFNLTKIQLTDINDNTCRNGKVLKTVTDLSKEMCVCYFFGIIELLSAEGALISDSSGNSLISGLSKAPLKLFLRKTPHKTT